MCGLPQKHVHYLPSSIAVGHAYFQKLIYVTASICTHEGLASINNRYLLIQGQLPPTRGADKIVGIPASGYLVPSHFSQNLAWRINDVTFSQTTQRTRSAMIMDKSAVMSKLLDRGRKIIMMPKIGRTTRRMCCVGYHYTADHYKKREQK